MTRVYGAFREISDVFVRVIWCSLRGVTRVGRLNGHRQPRR